MALIEARNISKIYMLGEVEVPALRGVSLDINRKDFVVIIGPSGSGKSTLMHLLGALDHPSSGEIIIDNHNISHLDDHELALLRRHKIGFVFQAFHLIPTLNAFENVLIPTETIDANKHELEERAVKLLKEVGLEDRMFHLPSQLSGGQRQRVSIARALINNPDIILADEPTGNLDSATGQKIIDLMLKLNQEEKKTFVIVSHDESFLSIVNKSFHLKDGLIVKTSFKKQSKGV